MYRNCIFCAADLKGNDALERFPVGRGIAFDGEKGRLWAICPRCARWNLAPLEERWEAVEDAERLFRAAPTRVHRENIGLAKLADGTRLVRVGQARDRELVAWRYGETFVLRWRRANRLAVTGVALGVGAGGPFTAGLILPTLALFGAGVAAVLASGALAGAFPTGAFGSRIVHQARGPGGTPVPVRAGQLARARLRRDGGWGIELEVPSAVRPERGGEQPGGKPFVLRGDDARIALGRGLVLVNRRGGTRDEVARAQQALERAGTPERLLTKVARTAPLITGALVTGDVRYATRAQRSPDPQTMLSVEMAVSSISERRALHGELAALRELWRQAEEIAAIADRLPGPLLRRGHGTLTDRPVPHRPPTP